VSRASHWLLAVSLATLAIACVTERPKVVGLYPSSGAPPARRLLVDNRDDHHAIVVSRGVAFGVQVWDNCPGAPNAPIGEGASAPKLTIGDPKLLGVYGLSRDTSGRGWVLFGIQAGRTTVTLEAPCAKQVYEVEVVAP
jgi:hypothetical protein